MRLSTKDDGNGKRVFFRTNTYNGNCYNADSKTPLEAELARMAVTYVIFVIMSSSTWKENRIILATVSSRPGDFLAGLPAIPAHYSIVRLETIYRKRIRASCFLWPTHRTIWQIGSKSRQYCRGIQWAFDGFNTSMCPFGSSIFSIVCERSSEFVEIVSLRISLCSIVNSNWFRNT